MSILVRPPVQHDTFRRRLMFQVAFVAHTIAGATFSATCLPILMCSSIFRWVLVIVGQFAGSAGGPALYAPASAAASGPSPAAPPAAAAAAAAAASSGLCGHDPVATALGDRALTTPAATGASTVLPVSASDSTPSSALGRRSVGWAVLCRPRRAGWAARRARKDQADTARRQPQRAAAWLAFGLSHPALAADHAGAVNVSR